MTSIHPPTTGRSRDKDSELSNHRDTQPAQGHKTTTDEQKLHKTRRATQNLDEDDKQAKKTTNDEKNPQTDKRVNTAVKRCYQ